MLKLLVPTMRIWLGESSAIRVALSWAVLSVKTHMKSHPPDVDNLEDVGMLERSVQQSAIFFVFLSRWYFASKNCRRELYTALFKNKPIVSIWESDENKGGASLESFRQEVREFCADMDEAFAGFRGPDEVLERIIDDPANTPIEWVSLHRFAPAPQI